MNYRLVLEVNYFNDYCGFKAKEVDGKFMSARATYISETGIDISSKSLRNEFVLNVRGLGVLNPIKIGVGDVISKKSNETFARFILSLKEALTDWANNWNGWEEAHIVPNLILSDDMYFDYPDVVKCRIIRLKSTLVFSVDYMNEKYRGKGVLFASENEEIRSFIHPSFIIPATVALWGNLPRTDYKVDVYRAESPEEAVSIMEKHAANIHAWASSEMKKNAPAPRQLQVETLLEGKAEIWRI